MAQELLPTFASRSDTIQYLTRNPTFDVVVIGGGIHGAHLAREAALNGLRVALLERYDYGAATSSRSSKMAHGGLRYLEQFDFRQVLEGIRSREELFKQAPHLVQPSEFLLPLKAGQNWLRMKLTAGLTVYDLMHGVRARYHRALSSGSPELNGLGSTGFLFWDGLMNDARLVIETIVTARQEGAICLNYAQAQLVRPKDDAQSEVAWTDVLTGHTHAITAGIVVNCCGPWVGQLGRGAAVRSVRFSQGSHLLFSKRVSERVIMLPLSDPGRYYFVWPHPSGSLVGTTEREVTDLPEDPQPSSDEVSEIIANLARDLPGTGLDRSSMFYGFAGIRTLPTRGGTGATAKLSRRHIWSYERGVLSLIGGKFTSAAWTAREGLKMIFRLAQLKEPPVPSKGRPYPGAVDLAAQSARFSAEAERRGIPSQIVQRIVGNLGARVKYFLESDTPASAWDQLGGLALRGEIDIAREQEQAEIVEDVMRRRLLLELQPGYGLEIVDQVAQILGDREGAGRYRARLERLQKLLASPAE